MEPSSLHLCSNRFLVLALSALALLHPPLEARGETTCAYLTREGVIRSVPSETLVPPEYRSVAKCLRSRARSEPKRSDLMPTDFGMQRGRRPARPASRAGLTPQGMALPSELRLEGGVRKVHGNSPLGKVELRWSRGAEAVFGRSPERAVADALSTVSKAIRRGGFPPQYSRFSENWQIVFMDEDVPETQIPRQLIENCHPAWMTPPANIYVVAQRVARGCGGSSAPVDRSKADQALVQVLLHEIGHGIEARLLGGSPGATREQAEGFATWFESYAADSSSLLAKGEVRATFVAAAKKARKRTTEGWQGDLFDYAKSSLVFHAIVERKGVPALIGVYRTMAEERLPLAAAIEKNLRWDEAKIEKEILRVVGE